MILTSWRKMVTIVNKDLYINSNHLKYVGEKQYASS